MTSMIQGSSIYAQAAAIVAGFGPLLIPIVGVLLLGWVMLLAFGLVGSSSADAVRAGRALPGALSGGGSHSSGRRASGRGSDRAARGRKGKAVGVSTALVRGKTRIDMSGAIADALAQPSTMLKPLDYGHGPRTEAESNAGLGPAVETDKGVPWGPES